MNILVSHSHFLCKLQYITKNHLLVVVSLISQNHLPCRCIALQSTHCQSQAKHALKLKSRTSLLRIHAVPKKHKYTVDIPREWDPPSTPLHMIRAPSFTVRFHSPKHPTAQIRPAHVTTHWPKRPGAFAKAQCEGIGFFFLWSLPRIGPCFSPYSRFCH